MSEGAQACPRHEHPSLRPPARSPKRNPSRRKDVEHAQRTHTEAAALNRELLA